MTSDENRYTVNSKAEEIAHRAKFGDWKPLIELQFKIRGDGNNQDIEIKDKVLSLLTGYILSVRSKNRIGNFIVEAVNDAGTGLNCLQGFCGEEYGFNIWDDVCKYNRIYRQVQKRILGHKPKTRIRQEILRKEYEGD